MDQKSLVVIFNEKIKEFFHELKKFIFVEKSSIDCIARNKISTSLNLLKFNKRTAYFINYWSTNLPSQFKIPIYQENEQFFFDQKINNQQKEKRELLDLLKEKGSTLSKNNKKVIFTYLQILLKISDVYTSMRQDNCKKNIIKGINYE